MGCACRSAGRKGKTLSMSEGKGPSTMRGGRGKGKKFKKGGIREREGEEKRNGQFLPAERRRGKRKLVREKNTSR